jgi:hypothetical protein
MPRDEVDPSLITNDRRKRKLPSYATNKDNISADKEQTVKRMKQTMNSSRLDLPDEVAAPSAASHHDSNLKATGPATSKNQPSNDINTEDDNAYPQDNIYPKNLLNIQHQLDLSDEDDNPRSGPKKSESRKQKKKKRTMVIDSSSDEQVSKKAKRPKKGLPVITQNSMVIDSMVVDSSDDQGKKREKLTKTASHDTDIEEVQNPKETSEQELGEW